MEARVIVACIAVCSGAVSAFFLAQCFALQLRRVGARRAAVGQGEGNGRLVLLARVLRNGVAPLIPLSEALMEVRAIRSLARRCSAYAERKGIVAAPERLLSAYLAASVAAGASIAVLFRSAVCGIAVVACATALGIACVNAAAETGRKTMQESVPDALRSMESCFQAGCSLDQTLRTVADEMHGDLRNVFQRSVRILDSGGTGSEALDELCAPDAPHELAFVSVALDVQHESGGSIKHVLDSARETVENELELARSLRVQTAQAQLSARIVSVMPFVLVALFSLVSPGFLEPFFQSAVGIVVLATAVFMQLAGILTVRRMLQEGSR